VAEAPAVAFEGVDIVFGDRPQAALPLIDAGRTREEILAATGQVLGVAGADLAIPRGQICVLMGLSGSGKSTLLRAVNGLNKVARGAVLVEDGDGRQVDVARCDPATLRRLRMGRVAMVFQQFALLPWRTVAENVAFGLELRGVPAAERARVVKEKLELVHLEAWAGKYAHELSGGMQQRVGLARAFATDADILLMDEPFSALDPLIRDKLQDELLELQARLRKTIVFVSHDLDEALKLGSSIAIMEGGRIVQAGAPEEIVTRPATDYVRSFVANVNPLNVLRLGSLMCPRERLEPVQGGGGWLWLDRRIDLRARLDGDGRPVALACAGRELGTVDALEDLGEPDAFCDRLVRGTPEAPIRLAIEGIRRSGWPVLVAEPGGGRLLGVVRIDEVLDALRRRPR
jgi:glycine betaine/proline transport system ATP-binding protein